MSIQENGYIDCISAMIKVDNGLAAGIMIDNSPALHKKIANYNHFC